MTQEPALRTFDVLSFGAGMSEVQSKAAGSFTNWQNLLAPGFRAIRRNWAPILLIQFIGFSLVIAYYRSLGVREFAQGIRHLKESGGVIFVIVSGAMAGGILPQIAKVITGRAGRIDIQFWKDTAFSGFVFALIGLEVDAFYKCQTVFFGTGADPITLIKKTALDMFVLTPILFNPTGMVLFHARAVNFRLIRVREALSWPFYRAWVVPTLPFNWAFWIPVVLCVYSLPEALQFPFSQISEACWSIFFVFMANEAATN